MRRDVSVTLRMSDELKTALQEFAEADRRTLSNYIEMVLENHVSALLDAQGAHSRQVEIFQAQSRARASKRQKRT